MKFRRFTLKHLTLVTVLPALIVWGVAVAVTYYNPLRTGFYGLVAFAAMALTQVLIRRYHAGFIKRAQKSLNDDCDPYPTIEEVKLYIECAGRRVSRAGLNSTLGMMYALAGDYTAAQTVLSKIDIGEASGLPEVAKAGMLYNYSALYCMMNMPQHAIDFYDRAKEAFASASGAMAERMKFDGPTDAEIACYKGDGRSALAILDAINPTCRLQEVTKRFTLAKVRYISGERAAALEDFKWVASNDGRLGCIKESAEIAQAIEKSAPDDDGTND